MQSHTRNERIGWRPSILNTRA